MQHPVPLLLSAFFTAVVIPPAATSSQPDPLPPTDTQFNSTHFSGSGNCGSCHNDLRDANGVDVSLERDWEITIMGNSARDPLWQAKVASEIKRNPHLEDELNAICTRCHAPMANIEAEAVGEELELFDDGLIDVAHPDYDAAMDGVSCTLCHQIADNGLLGTEDAASGGFTIDQTQKVAYGPVIAPQTNPMQRESGYRPAHGPHLGTSEVCGTCHDLKTPFVDADGIPVELDGPHGGFPEQMVYTEWENSAYAPGKRLDKSCQDCHMPETDGVPLANRPSHLTPVDNFSRHTFLGANTVMLDIIDANSEELGATAADFTPAIENNRANLAAAAKLHLVKNKIVNGKLKTRIAVQNLTGHKLPSGYPSRRMFLHYVLKDQTGKIIFESGRMRDDGSIKGVNADWDPEGYEPHFDYITNPRQVQVYESIMHNTDGEVTHTLLEAAGYLKDNRLGPAGFNKDKVPDEIAVRGRAAEDANFNWAWDTVTYLVPLPEAEPGDTFTVQVELKYQPLSFGYLKDLFEDADEPAVARFKRMYEASSLRAETVGRMEFEVVR